MADATKKTDGWTAGRMRRPPARRVAPGRVLPAKCAARAKKVTWPTWKETWLTTMMVFIMVGLMMVFFFVVDFVLALWRACCLIGARRMI